MERDWFTIDGSLEPIDFEGDSHNKFTAELAEIVLKEWSKEGDWVLDPFVGLGTTVQAAQKLNRHAVGFEVDAKRVEFASRGVMPPNKIIHDQIENIGKHELPRFDLVFTSPPYAPVRLADDPYWGEDYFKKMEAIFRDIRDGVKPGGSVVVEVSNIHRPEGFRPLVWELGKVLSGIFTLQKEIARCDTSPVDIGPGVQHSSLLVFKR